MPEALASLAAWPVLASFIFLFRGLGMAYNEVVVALLEERGAWGSLRRFSLLLALGMTVLLSSIALSPLARGFFGGVMGLEPSLAALAGSGLLLALVWPALTVYQSLYQGVLVHSGKTQTITQSVVLSLLTSALLLVAGAVYGGLPGLYVVTTAFVLGSAVQVVWLMRSSRDALRVLEARDAQPVAGVQAAAAD